jgi:hypothetical protein
MVVRIVQALRDIRPDLKARLQRALARRDELADQIKGYEIDIDLLTRLIERENLRHQPGESQETPDEALSEFIAKTIQMRPMAKDELREYASRAGYPVDGRSIHATTVNLLRAGRIVELADGVFADPASEAAQLAKSMQ